jgi:enediyne biosynthesis protein E4
LISLFVLLSITADWPVVEFPHRFFSGETAQKPLPAAMSGGIAVVDFDGDGLLDVFFVNGGELPSGKKTSTAHSNRLYRNLGKLRFEDVTRKAGLEGSEYSFGASAGDFDGDGKPDLLVTTLRGVTLYRNQGRGTFTDVTRTCEIDNQGRWAVGAAWVDIDNDGDLDLFLVNYVAWNPATEQVCRTAGRVDFCHPRYYQPVPNALFRNDNGRFTDISRQSGIAAHPGKGMGVAVADFDNDGRMDLFVTNDRMPAFLFHATAKGTFEEIGLETGVSVPSDGKAVSGMGVDVQDFDGDGKPDLVYTALKDETFPLYRTTANGFEDASTSSGLAPLSRKYPGWGVVFADLDNDGLRDIVAATSDALSGMVDSNRKGPVVWFRNAGHGRFEGAQSLSTAAMHRGVVAADLDRDGCLDLVVSALDTAPRVLRNPCRNPKPGAKRQWPGSSAVGYASSLWEK